MTSETCDRTRGKAMHRVVMQIHGATSAGETANIHVTSRISRAVFIRRAPISLTNDVEITRTRNHLSRLLAAAATGRQRRTPTALDILDAGVVADDTGLYRNKHCMDETK